MKLTRLIPFTSATLVSLLLVAAYATAAAQRPAHAQAPAAHTPPAHPTTGPQSHPATEANAEKSFRGIASKLGMSAADLENKFEAEQGTNPKLTRGQFIAAYVLAKNLGSKNSAITSQAILEGLASGKSIGQTLHSLGLSESEAKEAERAADREVKEAKEAKPDQPKP